MGLFKPVKTKEELTGVADESKISVTFTRDEFEYLMDLIDRYEQVEPQSMITNERLKKKKKQDASLMSYMQTHLISITIIRERMLDALPETQ